MRLLGAVLLVLVAVALIPVAQVHDEHGTGDREEDGGQQAEDDGVHVDGRLQRPTGVGERQGDAMSGGAQDWRPVLRPATWVTCRFVGPEDGRGWRRLEAADARPADASLTILAGWGGGGRYHHTEVLETDREVRIDVLIQDREPVSPDPGALSAQTLELRTGIVEVHLAALLGDRTLVGVAGAEDALGSGLRGERSMPADVPPLEVVTP
jgi:hypothetical protein